MRRRAGFAIKKRILVIDDDVNIVQSLRTAIKYADIRCSLSIAETLETFADDDFCLVIMDIRLTEADGMEVLRIIRGMKNIPILVLTRELGTHEKAAVFREGATALLEKPVDITVCVAQINSLIQL